MLIGLTAATAILAGFEAAVHALVDANVPLVGNFVGLFAPALLGPRAGVILDVFTFLFSALMVYSIHLSARPQLAEGERALDLTLIGKDVVESFRFLGEHAELRGLLVTIGLAILGGGAIIPVGFNYVQDNLIGALPFADRVQLLQELTASPATFMLVFMALGMVVGALVRAAARARRQAAAALRGQRRRLRPRDARLRERQLLLARGHLRDRRWRVHRHGDRRRQQLRGAHDRRRAARPRLHGAGVGHQGLAAALDDRHGAARRLHRQAGAGLRDDERPRAESVTLTGSRITLQICSLIVLGAAVYAFRTLEWRACDEPPCEPSSRLAEVATDA